MKRPTSVMVECPACKEETLHQVLSGKIKGKASNVLDSTVKCRTCGRVHHVVLKSEKPVEVQIVVSWLTDSEKSKVVLGPDEVLTVGDEIIVADTPVLVTSIESNGARVEVCKARDIESAWGKRFDRVKLLFSVNHHGKSYSENKIVSPDEEFFVGDLVEVGKRDVVIHAIKTQTRTIRKGGASARDIVRVYANIVRKTSY